MAHKFLYIDIYTSLKNKIGNQDYLTHDKLPTEAQLEKEYRVSRITIKKALKKLKEDGLIYSKRGSGSYVAPSAQWTLAKPAIGLSKDTKVITMILPFDMADSSFVNTINGASKYLCEHGYYLNVRSNISSTAEELEVIKKSYEDVAGILLLPISGNANFHMLNQLYVEKYPLILLDRYSESLPLNYVTSNNKQGGYDATKYLLQLGHKKIGFVCDIEIERYTTMRDRYLGYLSAMKESEALALDWIHIGFNHDWQHRPDHRVYRKIIKSLLQQGVTAIFAANDLLASYIITEATNMGYLVPEDLSIIGFDKDPTISKYFFKSITTMEQGFYDMGKVAAQEMVRLIEGATDQIAIKLPTSLVEKDTCKDRLL